MARILLVDDEPTVREVICHALMGLGHHVNQAADGRAALDLLRAGSFDLVLTDLVMPGQDGIETIVALRQSCPALPVIAMSGDPNRAGLYLQVAKHLGVRRTLAKPFTIATLTSAVDEVLERPTVGHPRPDHAEQEAGNSSRPTEK